MSYSYLIKLVFVSTFLLFKHEQPSWLVALSTNSIDYAPISVDVSGKLALCSHDEKGSILLDVSGGVAPYSFLWNTRETSKDRTGLNAGTYTVVITDAVGTVHTERIVVQPPFPLILEPLFKQDESCEGSQGGYAKLAVKVGRGEPYQVTWSNGLKNVWEASNLSPGTYTVVVADKYNCEVSTSFEIGACTERANIPQASNLQARIETALDVNCEEGKMTGIAWVTIQGGKQPYEIFWDTGEKNTQEITFYKSGKLQVKVTDAMGTSTETEVAVEIPSQNQAANRLDFNYRKLQISNDKEVKVYEEVLFESKIADEFIAWEWAFGDGGTSADKDAIHVFKNPGNYEVTLTAYDKYGCSSVEHNTIQVMEQTVIVTIPNAFTPNGDGLNDTFLPKFITPTAYTLEIFNTWGERVFFSSGVGTEGWDGTYNNQESPAGNFIYQIKFTTLDGEIHHKTGGVSLIR